MNRPQKNPKDNLCIAGCDVPLWLPFPFTLKHIVSYALAHSTDKWTVLEMWVLTSVSCSLSNPSTCPLTTFHLPHALSLSLVKVIEEIVEMMENSPDPGETEEEDEEEGSLCSTRTNPSLLEEIRQLSQASNNNCSYEGKSGNNPCSGCCKVLLPAGVICEWATSQTLLLTDMFM